jgi:arylformamidase
MRIYDISLTISPQLPVWPGDPAVEIEQTMSLAAGDPVNLSQIRMGVHTGTHIDAPHHFVSGGATVENLPLKLLTGRAYVLHLPEVEFITAAVLQSAEIPPRTRRLLFRTQNSTLWAERKNDFHENYVGISPEAANLLVERGVRLVGVDYLSVAPYGEQSPTHEAFLKAGVVVVEGLDLSQVAQGRYTLYCLPLKLQGADGAPARAILLGV